MQTPDSEPRRVKSKLNSISKEEHAAHCAVRCPLRKGSLQLAFSLFKGFSRTQATTWVQASPTALWGLFLLVYQGVPFILQGVAMKDEEAVGPLPAPTAPVAVFW